MAVRVKPRLWLALVVAVAAAGFSARNSNQAGGALSAPKTVERIESTPSVSTGADAAAQMGEPLFDQRSTVAEATGASVEVLDAPDGDRAIHRLSNPQPSGAPLVFLVVDEGEAPWLRVLLPVRPNGSTGWVHESEVSTFEHNFRVLVELGLHRITVYKGNEVFLQEPIGVGTKDTPTPGGLYYIKELLQPPDPNTVYGPYAYGLSGFSNVLANFAGGEGVIGIHGNNDPSTLGKDVSHGCIRMSNAGITKLATTLPLGVPVEIRP